MYQILKCRYTYNYLAVSFCTCAMLFKTLHVFTPLILVLSSQEVAEENRWPQNDFSRKIDCHIIDN